MLFAEKRKPEIMFVESPFAYTNGVLSGYVQKPATSISKPLKGAFLAILGHSCAHKVAPSILDRCRRTGLREQASTFLLSPCFYG